MDYVPILIFIRGENELFMANAFRTGFVEKGW